MINTSNEYKSRIRRNRKFYKKSPLELADGTLLNLADSDFINDGFRVDDSVGEKIALGTVVINRCTYYLNNFSGKFNLYDFTDAVLRPQSGLQLSETVEYLHKGVFTVDNPGAKGSIIVLEALDNMAKLNTEFSNVTISFPCTNLQLLQAVCLHCGISLASARFLNDSYICNLRPADETISCREVVSWIAQMARCFARCNVQGALELKWYDFEAFEQQSNINGGSFDGSTPYATGDNVDGGNFTDYTSGDSVDGGSFTDMDRYHHIYSFSGSPTIGTDDIVITGVQVTDSAETPTTVLFGSSGYVLPIAGNLLIQNSTQAALIANTVGARVVGMKFRQFSGSAQSDPSMEAGDVAYASDRKGNSYQVLLTSLSYSPGNYEPVTCGAETPAKRNFRPTPEMKAIVEARKAAKQEISMYDLVQKEFNNLVFHSFGLFYSEEVLEDGSTIKYGHDQPTLAESQNIWKQTADAFSVSDDGGLNYRGMDAKGNILANVLTAIGVNAEWIRVLTSFTVGDFFSVDAQGKLKAINAEISGKIIAEMGKIGPYLIDEFGIESDVVRLSEHPMFPGMRLRKKGDSGKFVSDEDNNSREMNLQSGYQVFETINDGIKTVIRITGKNDSVTDTDGKIIITKLDISDEFEQIISRVELSDVNGIETRKYENGITTRMARLLDSAVELEHDGHTGKVILNGDGSMNMVADNGVSMDGTPISDILSRLDTLEARL